MEWEDAEYSYDKRHQEELIQRSLSFVQEHEVILKKINEQTRVSIAEAPVTHYRPIRIANTVDNNDKVNIGDLLYTDNELLRKVLSVLVYLCDEIRELVEVAEARLYRPLQSFGVPIHRNGGGEENEDDNGHDTLQPGDKETQIGHFLPTLQDVCNFTDRSYDLIVNVVQNLASLINNSEALYRTSLQSAHLGFVFQSLGNLLTVLISIDNIIESNEHLKESWEAYKAMVTYIRQDPAAYGMEEASISKFERLLVSIDQTLMIGTVFSHGIEQNYEEYCENNEDLIIAVRSNELFFKEMLLILKNQLDSSLKILGTGAEMFERREVVGGLCLYALYRKLLPPNVTPDAKLHKYMWEIQKLVPCIVLADTVLFCSGEFLHQHAYFEIKKPDPPNPAAYRRTYITEFDSNLSSRTQQLLSQCSAWSVLAESRIQPCVRHESDLGQSMDVRGSILLKGLSLANRCCYLAKSSLVMHSSMQVPFGRSSLLQIAQLVESLKAIEFTILRKDTAIAESIVHILHVSFQAIASVLAPVIKKLESTRKLDQQRSDLLNIVRMIENCIYTSDSLSISRQVLLTACAQISTANRSLFSEREGDRLQKLIQRVCMLSSFQRDIVTMADTGFLFYHQDILSVMVQDIYKRPTEANRLQYLLAAFADGIKICEMIRHTDQKPYFIAYRQSLSGVVKEGVISPLCHEIENNLRLHIHTKNLAHLDTIDPKQQGLSPLRPFLDLSPIHVLGLVIDVKQEVRHYLDLNFYNLTTVALHDWRTYAEMRALAQEKFGLVLMDNFLPMGSLDQGLDVLQIMRNIHIFVSRFSYNMNMNQFVEFKPDKNSKHINSIRIQSIAASLRQHGLGVLNTTVNYTYQFLRKKFHIFSQFLFDDYIKAHLSREHRWYRKHKYDEEVNTCYPYERAKRFVTDIRRLPGGMNKDGKSYLDMFRLLITEIGNALGYVRMVRSAGMFYCSQAVTYLPDFENVINFADWAGKGAASGASDGTPEEEGAEGAAFCEETIRAGKNLDSVISNLINNFGEGSDYFKVIVKTFQALLVQEQDKERKEKKAATAATTATTGPATSEDGAPPPPPPPGGDKPPPPKEQEKEKEKDKEAKGIIDHLKIFYMIVPALCISWVDASLQAKDNLYKISNLNRGGNVAAREMYFTDDGFAMGLAYCLAILKQTRKWESLHWVDTVRSKHKSDAKELHKAREVREEKDRKKAEAKAKKNKKKNSIIGSLFGGGKKDDSDDEIDYEDEEDAHLIQLSGKKLEAQRRESEQLFYSLSGAKIFFRKTDIDI